MTDPLALDGVSFRTPDLDGEAMSRLDRRKLSREAFRKRRKCWGVEGREKELPEAARGSGTGTWKGVRGHSLSQGNRVRLSPWAGAGQQADAGLLTVGLGWHRSRDAVGSLGRASGGWVVLGGLPGGE